MEQLKIQLQNKNHPSMALLGATMSAFAQSGFGISRFQDIMRLFSDGSRFLHNNLIKIICKSLLSILGLCHAHKIHTHMYF